MMTAEEYKELDEEDLEAWRKSAIEAIREDRLRRGKP